jgi:hypothetical protein
MKTQTQHVLQSLFSEDSIENIPIEKLRQLVEEHPYFTLGHLLLAQKLQTLDAAEYEAQSEKTCLYFNEPIWLQSLLHPSEEKRFVLRERSAIDQADHENEQSEEIKDHEHVVVQKVVLIKEVSEEELELFPPPPPDFTSQQNVAASTSDQSQASAQEEQTSINEAPPIFEPYHTVDYFASQGIRVSNEIKPDDKLGEQLRRFTEWLKTMKRLPETKVEQQLDEVTQQNIQEFADHSLDRKDIITESMAEVLIKQHKQSEAIGIYEKLSLLNPSKRAYFAAKIEQLKGS